MNKNNSIGGPGSYGWQKAMQRQHNKQTTKQQATGGPTQKTVGKNNSEGPKLETWPARQPGWPNLNHQHIRWENTPNTHNITSKIRANRLTILTLPTGYGKTSIAVRAWASLLEQDPGLWAVIVCPKSVKEQHGWQATINSWNQHAQTTGRPVLDPFMIETPERWANILDHPKTLKVLAEQTRQSDSSGLLIIDEFHGYKNPVSKRSKTLRKWGGQILGVTATPFTNDRVLDSVSYLVHNRDFSSKTAAFRELDLDRWVDRWHRLDIYKKDGGLVTGFAGTARVIDGRLARILVRPPVLEADSRILPDVASFLHSYDCGVENGRVESLMLAGRAGLYDNLVELAHDIQTTVCTGEERTRLLLDLVGGPGVRLPLVFYSNTMVGDHLERVLEGAGWRVGRVSGQHKIGDLDPELAGGGLPGGCLLLQYQSGSEGIEFPASNTTVFFQNQYSYTRLVQAAGRNVRRSNRDCRVVHHEIVGGSLYEQQIFERVHSLGELNDEMVARILESIIK